MVAWKPVFQGCSLEPLPSTAMSVLAGSRPSVEDSPNWAAALTDESVGGAPIRASLEDALLGLWRLKMVMDGDDVDEDWKRHAAAWLVRQSRPSSSFILSSSLPQQRYVYLCHEVSIKIAPVVQEFLGILLAKKLLPSKWKLDIPIKPPQQVVDPPSSSKRKHVKSPSPDRPSNPATEEQEHCQGHSTQCSQRDKCLFCGQTSPTSHCQ